MTDANAKFSVVFLVRSTKADASPLFNENGSLVAQQTYDLIAMPHATSGWACLAFSATSKLAFKIADVAIREGMLRSNLVSDARFRSSARALIAIPVFTNPLDSLLQTIHCFEVCRIPSKLYGRVLWADWHVKNPWRRDKALFRTKAELERLADLGDPPRLAICECHHSAVGR